MARVTGLDRSPAASDDEAKDVVGRLVYTPFKKSKKEISGERLLLDRIQATGLRCKNSGIVIQMEYEARFCGCCGQVYQSKMVPITCSTCHAKLLK